MAVTLVGIGVLSALVLFLVMGARGPAYTTVYRHLDPADASQMVEILDLEKISYKISEGGSALQVLPAEADRVRLLLAGQGLPQGGSVGFEILDKTRLGSSEFERHTNYVRALQGELSRTLLSVSHVEQARVHIVLPESSLFVTESRPATAAVFLKVRPLADLDSDQIRGIVHLVAGSVEGLSPENVTVVDYHGRILSSNLYEDPENGYVRANQDVLRQFQRDLQTSVETLLEQVFGPRNVLVRINAEMDFDQRVVERSFFEPAETADGLVRSVQELEEVFRGEGSMGGIPSQGDIPGYPADGQSGPQEYSRTEVTRNVELNQIQERIVVAPGTVKRLSVAVVINRNLSAEEAQAVENTVSAAIGLDPERSDQITVTGIAFNTAWLDEIMGEEPPAGETEGHGRLSVSLLVAGGLVILVLFALLVLARRRSGKKGKALEPARVEIPEDTLPSLVSAIQKRKSINEVERLVREKPEAAAQLIQAWLAEDR